MIRHLVFFKFPNDTESTTKEAQQRLLTMRGKVPTLLDIEVGIDIDRSERAWDLVLETSFASKEDLAMYQADPVHLEVISWLKLQQTQTCVVDYIRD